MEHVGSILMPVDEVVFSLIAARDEWLVRELNERAGLPVDRITVAISLSSGPEPHWRSDAMTRPRLIAPRAAAAARRRRARRRRLHERREPVGRRLRPPALEPGPRCVRYDHAGAERHDRQQRALGRGAPVRRRHLDRSVSADHERRRELLDRRQVRRGQGEHDRGQRPDLQLRRSRPEPVLRRGRHRAGRRDREGR